VVAPCVGAPLNASLTSVSGSFGMSHHPLPHLSNQASSHSSVTVAPHVNTSLNTIRDSGSTVAPRVGVSDAARASGLQNSLIQPLACTTSHNPCVASASSLGQVVVGGNVINFAAPPSTATAYLATHSLTNSYLATYSLTNSYLATYSLTNSNLATCSLTNSYSATYSLTNSNLATCSLTTSYSATYSLTSSNLATCSLTDSNTQATNAKPFALKLKTNLNRSGFVNHIGRTMMDQMTLWAL